MKRRCEACGAKVPRTQVRHRVLGKKVCDTCARTIEVEAGITPATTESHGPWRKVVALEPIPSGFYGHEQGWLQERLECGHKGEAPVTETFTPGAKQASTKRRCWQCALDAGVDTSVLNPSHFAVGMTGNTGLATAGRHLLRPGQPSVGVTDRDRIDGLPRALARVATPGEELDGGTAFGGAGNGFGVHGGVVTRGGDRRTASDLGYRYDTYIVKDNEVIAGPLGADDDAVAIAQSLGGQAVDYEVLGSMVGLTDPQGLIRTSMRHIAHDSGDGEVIYHCPFCGSGNVVARSDKSAECGFCNTTFTVQVQPQHPYMPQTIDGKPYQDPDMPGQVTDPAMEGTQPTQPADNAADDSLVFKPPGAELAFDPGEKPAQPTTHPGTQPFPPQKSSLYYLSLKGDVLPEDGMVKHLALNFADDPQEVLAVVRRENGLG